MALNSFMRSYPWHFSIRHWNVGSRSLTVTALSEAVTTITAEVSKVSFSNDPAQPGVG